MPDSLRFGTSGLRGLATDLVGAPSAAYARAFLDVLAARGAIAPGTDVLVGRDLRESSPDIAGTVIGAIAEAGHVPRDCGVLPTPALALAAITRHVPAIMVTGSHIPADRNGLKFYGPDGEIGKPDEQAIADRMAAAPATRAAPVPLPATPLPEALAEYRARYIALWPGRPLAGRRIGVYQHATVARDLLAEVLDALGAQVVALGRSDGFVAIDTEAIAPDMARTCADWVSANRLDALVSADGDADRPLVVDDTGAVVRGDVLGALTARALGADAVVTPVTSNSAIEGTGWFASVTRTRVGSPFVIAGMPAAMAAGKRRVVGFEANGGVLLGTDARLEGRRVGALPTRDAMLPVLCVLTGASARNLPLSELVGTLPARAARSARLEGLTFAACAAFMERLAAPDAADRFLAPRGAVAERSDIDGLRFVLAGGEVIHYRPSGNAPELRCYTEAADAARAEALLAWGLSAAAEDIAASA